jgi:hypothetical protein
MTVKLSMDRKGNIIISLGRCLLPFYTNSSHLRGAHILYIFWDRDIEAKQQPIIIEPLSILRDASLFYIFFG